MKKYIGLILTLGSLLILFYTLMDLKEQVKEIPQLNQQIDSLQMELFNEKVDAGRHEITREDFLKTQYPKVYEEYNKFLESETE